MRRLLLAPLFLGMGLIGVVREADQHELIPSI